MDSPSDLDFSSYHETVSLIRQIITEFQTAQAQQREPEVDPARVEYINEKFSAFSTEINRRIALCTNQLRVMNAPEAMRLSRIAPDLMDLISDGLSISAEDWSFWSEVIRFNNFPWHEPLDIAGAEALNQAFQATNPEATQLLDQMRTLILARASLKDRLAILWNLGPLIPIYQDDIIAWERKRFEELEVEFDDCRRLAKTDPTASITAISALAEELLAPNWTTLVERRTQLLKNIEKFHLSLGKKQRENEIKQGQTKQRDELSALARDIAAAYQLMDEPRLLRSLKTWQTKPSTNSLPDTDELSRMVAPAIEWLRAYTEQQQHSANLEDLRIAITSGTSPAKHLQTLLATAERTGNVPPEMRQSVLLQIDRRSKERVTRLKLVLFGVALLLMVAVGGVASLFYQQYVDSNKRRIEEQTWADFLDATTRAKDQLISEAKKYADQATFARPLPESRPVIDAYDLYASQLSGLRERETVSADRARLRSKLESDLDQGLSPMAVKLETSILNEAADILKELTQREALAEAQMELDKVKSVLQSITPLRKIFPKLNHRIELQDESLKQAVSAAELKLAEREKMDAVLLRLTETSLIPADGNQNARLDSYAQILRDFSKDAPRDDSRSKSFTEAASLLPEWKNAYEQNSGRAVGWLNRHTRPGSSEERWTCQSKFKSAGNGKEMRLKLAYRPANTPPQWIEIGTLKGGKFDIQKDLPKDARLPGLLIFAVEK